MKDFVLSLIYIILISKYYCEKPLKERENEKYVSYFNNSSIETINDYNFDRVMNAGITNDYLILFTVRQCKVCNNILKILEEVSKYYTNSNVTFYKIDVIESGWTSLRFELERLPNLIFVSKGKYAIYPKDNLTALDVKYFIEDKNKLMMLLPKKVGYIYLIVKTFRLISYMIAQKFSFWDESYYWVLIIAFILFFGIVEYSIIKFCCRRSNKNKKNGHEHHHNHQNQMNKRHKSKAE